MYFLKKLLNMIGDDDFRMNKVLESEWYIMGLWPLVYSMILIPTGRRYFYLSYSFLSITAVIMHPSSCDMVKIIRSNGWLMIHGCFI